MPAERLAEVAREIYGEDRVSVSPRLADAIDAAAALAEAGEAFGDSLGSGAVLVTGSVVTVGEARAMLRRHGPRASAEAAGVSGAAAPPVQERSPRRGMCAAVLSLEAITLGLTTPVMIFVADVAVGAALAIGLGLAVACLVVAGMLRGEWAYALGWLIQVGAIALGVVIPVMFFLGAAVRAAVGDGVLPGPQDRARAGGGVRRVRPATDAGGSSTQNRLPSV